MKKGKHLFPQLLTCLLALGFVTVIPAVRDNADNDEDHGPEIKVGDTVEGTRELSMYYCFVPEKSGAYLFDLTFPEESDTRFIMIHEISSPYDIQLESYVENDDVYAYLEKGKQYRIDTPLVDYKMKVSESDFGASYKDVYTLSKDEKTTFKINAASKSEISYTWYDEDNEQLDIKGNTCEYTNSVFSSQARSCLVNFGNGKNLTAPFFVIPDLHIDGILFNGVESESIHQVNLGESFTLEINVKDDADLRYNWEFIPEHSYRDSVVSLDCKDKKITIDSPDKSGSYYCTVTSDFTGENYSYEIGATVEIANGLELSADQGSTIYTNGKDSVTIKVEAKAADSEGLSYTWYKVSPSNKEMKALKNNSNELTLTNLKDYVSPNPCYITVYVEDKFGSIQDLTFEIVDGINPYLNDFISRSYNTLLGRNADDDGLLYWAGQLTDGTINGGNLVRLFIGSEEFTQKNYSDSDYVEILYNTLFGRFSDEEGKAYWLNQIANGLDKANVLEAFIKSKEWDDICHLYNIESGAGIEKKQPSPEVIAYVERLYTTALGRTADKDGCKYVAEELANDRLTGEAITSFFFISGEMEDLNLSNEEYVRRIYLTCMNREPDEEGLKFWVSRLNNGVLRVEVLAGFVRSEEFTEICNNAGIKAY